MSLPSLRVGLVWVSYYLPLALSRGYEIPYEYDADKPAAEMLSLYPQVSRSKPPSTLGTRLERRARGCQTAVSHHHSPRTNGPLYRTTRGSFYVSVVDDEDPSVTMNTMFRYAAASGKSILVQQEDVTTV